MWVYVCTCVHASVKIPFILGSVSLVFYWYCKTAERRQRKPAPLRLKVFKTGYYDTTESLGFFDLTALTVRDARLISVSYYNQPSSISSVEVSRDSIKSKRS